jgi:DNA polymerase elongation subunit (family B)
MNYEIVYSDTDSVFMYPKFPVDAFRLCLDFEGIADGLTNAIHNYCSLKWGIDNAKWCMTLDAEKVYRKCLFTSSKKKYRGERIWKDGEFKEETELVGFEAKRGDASKVLKDCQLRVQEILIASGKEEEIVAYLNQIIIDMYAGKLDKDLVLAKAINKARLSDYDTEPPHVKAAKMLEEKAGFRSGDTVRFVISGIDRDKKPAVSPIDPAHPDIIPRIQKAGYDYYAEKLIDMIERLLGHPLQGIRKGRDRYQRDIFTFGSVEDDGNDRQDVRESFAVSDDTRAVSQGHTETPISCDVQGAIPGLYDPEQGED